MVCACKVLYNTYQLCTVYVQVFEGQKSLASSIKTHCTHGMTEILMKKTMCFFHKILAL